jgi:hypothetical protein
MSFSEAIDRDAQDLSDLQILIQKVHPGISFDSKHARDLHAHRRDYSEQERHLDAWAWSLRRTWLALGHAAGDLTPKSPCIDMPVSRLASGSSVTFGYERELDVSVLEGRSAAYADRFEGWSTDMVICRSGQAALTCLLHYAIARWGDEGRLTSLHAGSYFETRSLLALWPDWVLAQDESWDREVDLLLLEPVMCDGQFGFPGTLPSVRHAILMDTTLAGPTYDVGTHLPHAPILFAFSSGLKLDQAGLELANVGIIRIYARELEAGSIAEKLRRIRGLTGAGLTLDELSALSAPWFLSRRYAENYVASIFANNRALATVIRQRPLFEEACHPSTIDAGQNAPFCALMLRDPTDGRYEHLVKHIDYEVHRRGINATKGGSFGFRGHRYELIKPDHGHSFVRIAMGWRSGFSLDRLCEFLAELNEHSLGRS